ncbi:MAG: Hsp33 family molecular chaperone HslO [Burkholderiaceae bacterium]
MSAIHKFLMAQGAVRIEAARLTDAWIEIAGMRAHPVAVQHMLGELVVASTLLSATLKFNGALALQLQGDGPVRLAVVECRPAPGGSNGWLVRATVKLAADAQISDDADFKTLVNPTGNSRFMVVLDPMDKLPGQQAYTGIVPLVGHTLADSLAHYFASSEQLPTQLWLAADSGVAAGVLIQRMPIEGGKSEGGKLEGGKSAAPDEDAWNRARILAGTIKPAELLALEATELVRRVFYEETVTVFEAQPVRFACSCSREKVAGVLRMLGRAEVESILAEQNSITVNCEYCDKTYLFDAVDAAAAFTDVTEPQSPGTLH